MSTVCFKESKSFEWFKEDMVGLTGSIEELSKHIADCCKWMGEINENDFGVRYSEGKWNVSEVVGHLIDNQLLFLNRMISICREDGQEVNGVDEDVWVNNSIYSELGKDELLDGYKKSSDLMLWMLSNSPESRFDAKGICNSIEISVRELITYLIGHERHHINFVKNKYSPCF